MQPVIVKGEVWEGSNPNLMWRAVGLNGSPLVQSDISAASLTIYDMSAGASQATAVVGPTSLTVSAFVFNTLQTDGYWTRDSTGYNVRYMVDASGFTNDGGKKYRACIKLTTTSYGTVWLVAEWQAMSVLTI